MPRPTLPLQGPPFPPERLVESLTRIDARRIAHAPVGSRARPETRTVEIGSIKAILEILNCGPMFRCPACDRYCRHLYCTETYGCFSCLGLDHSVRHGDRKWKDLRLANKWRAMLGVGPFPEPLPPISAHNQRLQRICQRIRVAETRLITRFQTANQALAAFAKAQKRRRRAARRANQGGSAGGSATL
jgi:hypothetical protein